VSFRVEGEGIDWMQFTLQADWSRGVTVAMGKAGWQALCVWATRPAAAFMHNILDSSCSPQWPSVPQGPGAVTAGCRVCGHGDGGGPHVGSGTCRRTAVTLG
jgi:hypothetical protein